MRLCATFESATFSASLHTLMALLTHYLVVSLLLLFLRSGHWEPHRGASAMRCMRQITRYGRIISITLLALYVASTQLFWNDVAHMYQPESVLQSAVDTVESTLPSSWVASDKWLQGCATNLSRKEPVPFRPHLFPGHHNSRLYRLGDCLRKCACMPGHGNQTMLAQYMSLGCVPSRLSPLTIKYKGGMNMTIIEQLLRMRDEKPGFTRPDPDALVIHLRLGDLIEETNATASRMLTHGAVPQSREKQWIRSVHEYLSDIKESNSTKIVIVGGSHQAESTKSRVYADCLQEAIALSGYTVTMRTDGFSPDQDFYYVSHAKRVMVSIGGFSWLMGHMAQRHGGIIIGSLAY